MILHWVRRIVAVFLAFFLLAMMFMILGILGLNDPKGNLPSAQHGLLELSADELESNVVPLDGGWNFFPGEFLSTNQINERLKLKEGHIIEVPHSWNLSDYQDSQDNAHGYGTYHLKIRVDESIGQLAIRLPTIGTAYTLYVDQIRLVSVGVPGETRSKTTPAYLPQIVTFIPSGNTFHLTIQAANFHYSWGGIWYSLKLGAPERVFDYQQHSLLRSVFLTGFLFAVAVYNVILFLLRRKESLPYLVAMLCTVFGLRALVIDDIILLHAFPALSFEQIMVLDYLTFYLGVPLFAQFLRSSFQHQFSRSVMVGIVLISLVYIVLLLLTSIDLSSRLLFSYQLLTVFIVITYSFYVLMLAVRQGEQGSLALLFGCGVLALTTVNDILYANEIGSAGYLASIGLVVYVLSQLYVTNMRLTEAFDLSEKLGQDLENRNKDLSNLTANLEAEVAVRTKELTISNQQLEAMANTDSLTGLANRRGIESIVEHEHERFRRSNDPYSVALIDLDNFKSINDNFSHETGDRVLAIAAQCLNASIRQQDIVARWGGEEFIVILPNTTLQGAVVVAEKIRKTIKDEVINSDKGPLSVTSTIGISEVGVSETFSECLNRADSMLYQGKKGGRDRVVH